MSAAANPGNPIPSTAESSPTMRARIDALVADFNDPHAFLREVRALVKSTPEETCEILSVIDQYYRLGRIRHAVYQQAESYLGALLVRGQQSSCISVPLLQRAGRAPAVQIDAPLEIPAPRPAPAEQSAPDSPAGAPANVDEIAGDLAPGDVLRGRYRLLAIVGRGGTGTIWEAIDQYLVGVDEDGRRLAIKILHCEVARRAQLISELLTEFVHLRSLSHPNIVRVHEFDRDGDTAFFTMELLTGAPLGRILSARNGTALDRAHAHTVIRDVGAALAHAHSRGIAHGDINPENIFLTGNGEVRVLDFGAAHRVMGAASTSGLVPAASNFIAAPSYASCEVFEGRTPDTRDDVFALACVAYFLFSGKHPFANRTAIEARAALWSPVRPAELTADQWSALREGLDWRRDRRPSDVAEWVHRLASTTAMRPLPKLSALLTVPPRRRMPGLLVALSAALILLTAGGVWMTNANGPIVPSAAAMHTSLGRDVARSHQVIVRAWHELLRSTASGNHAPDHITVHLAPVHGDMVSANRLENGRDPRDGGRSAGRPVATIETKAHLGARARGPRRGVLTGRAALARIELTANLIQVARGGAFAQIVIRRSGNWRRTVSFMWRTEPGTAAAGKDFTGFAARIAHIKAGRRTLSLFIPIVSDPTRLEPTRFYVKINDPGPGALLGQRTIAMITIPASE
ncbi:MAG TPA: protein kinase [Steroidobacteraceae bacterium]|nr:protein kinase [Steroidobacteraceae bacterium]